MDGHDLDLFERSLRHATGDRTGPALDAALQELGWPDALASDPRTAVSLLFGLQGSAGATSSAIDHVLVRGLGGLRGNAGAGVVLPALAQWHPPGRLHGDRLTVAGLATAALANRPTAVVVARAGDQDVIVVVPVPALTLRQVRGVDPGLGLLEVSADVAGGGFPTDPVPDWAGAVSMGQIAIGHELVGASRTMLELARVHSLERVQFGRPISRFQAVRHRLAEALVAIETAEALLDAAWCDASPVSAAMAKAASGRGARAVARHSQQVLAGIGFTTEHPLHGYVRRALVLDQLLGASHALTAALGTELLVTRQLPAQLPL